MEALRMATTNSTVNGTTNVGAPTGQVGNTNQTAATGSQSFTQTLEKVMLDSSSSSTSNPLIAASMPVMLVGAVEDSEQSTQNAASALTQLLNQLLDVEQGTQSLSDDESSSTELANNSVLIQLQLLLLQLVSSQGKDSADTDPLNPSRSLGLDEKLGSKLGAAANELFQVLANILNEPSKQSEKKPAVINLMDTVRTLLAQSTTATQFNQEAAQVEQISAAGGQQAALVSLQSGNVSRPVNHKTMKEQPDIPSTTPQPLVHIMKEGNGNSNLNLLAAKAILQAPIVQTTANSSSDGSTTNSELPIENAPISQGSDETTNQAVFRLNVPETIVKGETPVVSASRFAQEMSQLLKSMNIQSVGGQSSITITLMPEHLGQVDVRMSMQNGQLVAQFVADSLHGKDLLESQLPQLRAALQGQGLQVDRLEVTQSQESAFAMLQDQRQEQSSQQFNRNQQGNGENGDEHAIDFDAELAVLAARKATLAGSTFDASA